MNVDCPALHKRHHDKGYPFGERVPRRVRMLRSVRPDFPFNLDPDAKVLQPGMVMYTWTNSYGAVTAVFPDGKKLGLKPDEFEVVEWHDNGPSAITKK